MARLKGFSANIVYFKDEQTKDVKYRPLIEAGDQPAIELNREKMEKFLPELKKRYFDPTKHKTYLEQLGIEHPPPPDGSLETNLGSGGRATMRHPPGRLVKSGKSRPTFTLHP